ncbi:hypothetical protein AAFH96_33585, partial [Polymorphospora sp. 2-325]
AAARAAASPAPAPPPFTAGGLVAGGVPVPDGRASVSPDGAGAGAAGRPPGRAASGQSDPAAVDTADGGRAGSGQSDPPLPRPA